MSAERYHNEKIDLTWRATAVVQAAKKKMDILITRRTSISYAYKKNNTKQIDKKQPRYNKTKSI
mgnify:CR=1 FL=1